MSAHHEPMAAAALARRGSAALASRRGSGRVVWQENEAAPKENFQGDTTIIDNLEAWVRQIRLRSVAGCSERRALQMGRIKCP